MSCWVLKWSLYAHASTVHGEAVGVPEHDESGVTQTLPLVFKLRAVGPEELEYLFLGQSHAGVFKKPPSDTHISYLQLGRRADLVTLPHFSSRWRQHPNQLGTMSCHSPRGCREEDDLSVASSPPYPESLPATVRE